MTARKRGGISFTFHEPSICQLFRYELREIVIIKNIDSGQGGSGLISAVTDVYINIGMRAGTVETTQPAAIFLT